MKPRDYGEFQIDVPQEGAIILQLSTQAEKNPQKPGQAWGRIEVQGSDGEREEHGYKIYHVDLKNDLLTITEEWNGAETARKTANLKEFLRDLLRPQGPTPPPDPGPAEPGFHRRTFAGADLLIPSELRRWLLERAEEILPQAALLPRQIRVFGKGFQEFLFMPSPGAPGVAPGTGATLRALSARPGVERAVVEGWFPAGEGRGTAWLLEPGEDQEWWLAMRTFERRPGAIGVWTNPWSQREARGFATLPSPLRAVLEPPADEPAVDFGAPQGPEEPEIGMYIGDLKPGDSPPTTAQEVADRAARDFEGKLHLEFKPDEVGVIVFRGAEWELWRLRGEFPTDFDDMFRAIAARGAEPTSMAVLSRDIVPMEGEVYRALITIGEAQGRRWRRALLMNMNASNEVIATRIAVSDGGEVGSGGWIGVPPITDLRLFTLHSAEA